MPMDHLWRPTTLASIAIVSKEKWFALLSHAWEKWMENLITVIQFHQLQENVALLNISVVSSFHHFYDWRNASNQFYLNCFVT